MRPNFDINLPSIPGKTIKFKIQDIKQNSFGSKKQRFNDNKKGLTKKFIESFNNFHQNKDASRLQQQTQASQSNSRISLKQATQRQKNEIKFRHIIPEDRKHVISLYDKYKEYEVPVLKQNKFDKGFTFNRAPKQNQGTQSLQHEEEIDKWTKKFVTDNYYFTATLLQTSAGQASSMNNQKTQAQKKRQKPSAVFKNQPRQRVWDRNYKSQVPGPGFYKDQEKQEPKQRTKRTGSLKQQTLPQNDYKKLKQIITSIVAQKKQDEESQSINAEDSKKDKMQYMFVQDDRDRFGYQKYPIAARLNVPGPGAYDILHSMEDQAKKVSLVEEQRKLLKEWFNN